MNHWLKIVSVCLLSVLGSFMPVSAPAAPKPTAAPSPPIEPEHLILFVLEGFGQESLKTGGMPVLSRLVKDGSVTWSATAVSPPLRLPTMASLLTGMPVEQHGVTWNAFDFIRGYPRPPTVFDYLDLSGGKDSAIFFMDESLYQLAKPEPYTDYQMCGPLKPECNPATMVGYIREYFRKANSGHGYGHAILSLPHLLVVHLPQPGRVGQSDGWKSAAYRDALKSVDAAIGAVLDLYKELDLLKKTTIFVTSLSPYGASLSENGTSNGSGAHPSPDPGAASQSKHEGGAAAPKVPWIASGASIKAGHTIHQPVSIIDTGATLMRALGLETHTEWQSHSVDEIFTQPPTVRPKAGTTMP
jgi:predicted AlkP superfamily pyrophosphatase or phosphodiesterase